MLQRAADWLALDLQAPEVAGRVTTRVTRAAMARVARAATGRTAPQVSNTLCSRACSGGLWQQGSSQSMHRPCTQTCPLQAPEVAARAAMSRVARAATSRTAPQVSNTLCLFLWTPAARLLSVHAQAMYADIFTAGTGTGGQGYGQGGQSGYGQDTTTGEQHAGRSCLLLKAAPLSLFAGPCRHVHRPFYCRHRNWRAGLQPGWPERLWAGHHHR